jgi:hypothetical protein
MSSTFQDSMMMTMMMNLAGNPFLFRYISWKPPSFPMQRKPLQSFAVTGGIRDPTKNEPLYRH